VTSPAPIKRKWLASDPASSALMINMTPTSSERREEIEKILSLKFVDITFR
jgi:hypothetical protein